MMEISSVMRWVAAHLSARGREYCRRYSHGADVDYKKCRSNLFTAARGSGGYNWWSI